MVLYEGSPPAHLPLALCPHSLLSLPTSPSTLAPSPSNKQQPVAGGALGRRHWGPQSPFCFSLHTATQDLPWQPGQMEMCARREEREGKGPQRGPGSCRHARGLCLLRPVLPLSVCAGCSSGQPCVRVSVSQWLHARACCRSPCVPCSVCLLVSAPGACVGLDMCVGGGGGLCECVCLNGSVL